MTSQRKTNRRNMEASVAEEKVLAAIEQADAPVSILALVGLTGMGKGCIECTVRRLVLVAELHFSSYQQTGHAGQKRKLYALGPPPDGYIRPPVIVQPEPQPIPRPVIHPIAAWGITA